MNLFILDRTPFNTGLLSSFLEDIFHQKITPALLSAILLYSSMMDTPDQGAHTSSHAAVLALGSGVSFLRETMMTAPDPRKGG